MYMHITYKPVVVNQLFDDDDDDDDDDDNDDDDDHIKPELTGHNRMLLVQSPEAVYKSRVQERYTRKGHDLVGRYGRCCGQLPLDENAVRCVWASAS